MPNKLDPTLYPQFRGEVIIMKEHEPRVKLYPVGSYETVADGDYNDIDILCLYPTDRNLEMFFRFLQDGDWVRDGQEYGNGLPITSFRALFNDQTFNLIVTQDEAFCNKFLKAANLCKHLNLTTKDHRVFVHEMFRQGVVQKNIWEIEV